MSIVAAYVVSWTPYAVIVFIFTFHGSVSNNFIDVSMFLAKLSTAYNPIILSMSSKSFRSKVIAFVRSRRDVPEGSINEREDLAVNERVEKKVSSSSLDRDQYKENDTLPMIRIGRIRMKRLLEADTISNISSTTN